MHLRVAEAIFCGDRPKNELEIKLNQSGNIENVYAYNVYILDWSSSDAEKT